LRLVPRNAVGLGIGWWLVWRLSGQAALGSTLLTEPTVIPRMSEKMDNRSDRLRAPLDSACNPNIARWSTRTHDQAGTESAPIRRHSHGRAWCTFGENHGARCSSRIRSATLGTTYQMTFYEILLPPRRPMSANGAEDSAAVSPTKEFLSYLAVRTRTVVLWPANRRAVRTSPPGIPGSMRSRMIASKAHHEARCKPSFPSRAMSTTNPPLFEIAFARFPVKRRSSSITKTCTQMISRKCETRLAAPLHRQILTIAVKSPTR
jgi:hypothetical protein